MTYLLLPGWWKRWPVVLQRAFSASGSHPGLPSAETPDRTAVRIRKKSATQFTLSTYSAAAKQPVVKSPWCLSTGVRVTTCDQWQWCFCMFASLDVSHLDGPFPHYLTQFSNVVILLDSCSQVAVILRPRLRLTAKGALGVKSTHTRHKKGFLMINFNVSFFPGFNNFTAFRVSGGRNWVDKLDFIKEFICVTDGQSYPRRLKYIHTPPLLCDCKLILTISWLLSTC